MQLRLTVVKLSMCIVFTPFCVLAQTPGLKTFRKKQFPGNDNNYVRPPLKKLDSTAVNFFTFSRQKTEVDPIWVQRNNRFLKHPEAGIASSYTPKKGAIELFAKRTIDAKTYIDRDNPSIQYFQKSTGPMHYKKDGEWVTIDTRLSRLNAGTYEASNQPNPVGFDVSKAAAYIVINGEKIYFDHWKLLGEKNGKLVAISSASWVRISAGDDGIIVKDIFPGMDAEMQVQKGAVATKIIIRKNLFGNYSKLVFKYQVSDGSQGAVRSIQIPGKAEKFAFVRNSRPAIDLQEGYAYGQANSAISYQKLHPQVSNSEVSFSLTKKYLDEELSLGSVVISPLSAINYPSAPFPEFYIDSSYRDPNESDPTRFPDGSICPKDVTMNLPAHVTVTDVLYTFSFISLGQCTSSNGGYRFGLYNCFSTTWQGTGTTPGSITATTNSSMGGSIWDCAGTICISGAILPFQFYFLRTGNGQYGCANDCIKANSDLTITLVCHGLDSIAVTPATDTAVCEGTPLTLTATANYGYQGGYTYTWYDNLNNIVGTQSTLNISAKSDSPGSGSANYRVEAKDGCWSGEDGEVADPTLDGPYSVNEKIEIINAPVPVLTFNSHICPHDSLVFLFPAIDGVTYKIENDKGFGSDGYTITNNRFVVYDVDPAKHAGVWTAGSENGNCISRDTSVTVVISQPSALTFTDFPLSYCINSGNYALPQPDQEIPGTWDQDIISTATVGKSDYNYKITGVNNCYLSPATLNITVLASAKPSFTNLGPYCLNSNASLPLTTSDGTISGVWSPAFNTTQPGVSAYVFSPSTSGTCIQKDTEQIEIRALQEITFEAIPPICIGSTAPVFPTPNPKVTGTWNAPAISVSSVGSSSYTFTPDSTTCGIPKSITVVVNSSPKVEFDSSYTIMAGQAVTLNPDISGISETDIASYNWTPATDISNASIKSPSASPQADIRYTLTVTSDSGCVDSGSVSVLVSKKENLPLSIPNVFSPNGDHNHDTWSIKNIQSYPASTISVFNRYGQLLIKFNGSDKEWDGNYNGNPLPVGTYYYLIDLKNGKKLSGSVSILR